MMNKSRNALFGRNGTGYRFKFLVPSISRIQLYLPLEMQSIPQIQSLIHGDSPLAVFGCHDLSSARQAFCELRKKYDFDFWAASEYFIKNIYDPDEIIPLYLNNSQFYVIDILRKRLFNRDQSRYVISKSSRRCGLTTCIQAYILWMQTFFCRNNSYTCSPSSTDLFPLKESLCRYLHRYIVPPDMGIFLPKVDGCAFFNTFRSPDAIRGINLGYVHLANMSHWHDPDAKLASRAFSACVSAVLLEYFTLVVLEGDMLDKDRSRLDPTLMDFFRFPSSYRMEYLSRWFRNPFFANEVLYASRHHDGHFLYINLDKAK